MAREALKNEMNIMIKSSPVDLVTATDQKVEKMLISSIKEKYPSHRYFLFQFLVIKMKSRLESIVLDRNFDFRLSN